MKVRAALAVGPKGRWNVHGWGRTEEVQPDDQLEDMLFIAREGVDTESAVFWIEFDAPEHPGTQVVEGEVISAG